MSYERKLIVKTTAGMIFSAVLAAGKFAIGLFTDADLCVIALYTAAILLSKLECVLGATNDRRPFGTRIVLCALFLFVSSVFYVGYMSATLLRGISPESRGLSETLIVVFLSFCELGFAVAGIFGTKNKGCLYRNIRLINFCAAIIAILTAQTAILAFCATENACRYNAGTGIGVGCFIALCAAYIVAAPAVGFEGRENASFLLTDPSKNTRVDMEREFAELVLCRSGVYGSYVFSAKIDRMRVDGTIARKPSLWKRMHPCLKVLCCVLSEILVFAWLFGRLIFFLRSLFLPRRLAALMEKNGFTPCAAPAPSEGGIL